MAKKSFTTRLDEQVLELAQRLAESERRSVTSLIEVAVIEYAQRRGIASAAVKQLPSSAEAAAPPPFAETIAVALDALPSKVAGDAEQQADEPAPGSKSD